MGHSRTLIQSWGWQASVAAAFGVSASLSCPSLCPLDCPLLCRTHGDMELALEAHPTLQVPYMGSTALPVVSGH